MAHAETIRMGNNKVDSEVLNNFFLCSCYECSCKSIYHSCDITIAYYWGMEKTMHGFNDDKAVSLVMVNTEKEQEYLKREKNNVDWHDTRI